MKLHNTTDFPNHFLRRMVSWCCKELGLPVQWVKHGTFKKTRNGRCYSGLGGTHKFTCRIGPESAFPSLAWRRGGVTVPSFSNRTDALVELTLHELQHLNQRYLASSAGIRRHGLHTTARDVETDAQFAAVHGFKEFLKDREALLATWNFPAPPKPAKEKVPAVEKRAAKVDADLSRWTRKLKLAQTKIRKLKQRQRYYERKQAACKEGS